MKVIRTVDGDIAPGELGITLTHEHLWCDQRLCRSQGIFPSAANPMVLQDMHIVVGEVGEFVAAGGRAIPSNASAATARARNWMRPDFIVPSGDK